MMAPVQPSDSRQLEFLHTEDSSEVSVVHTTDTKRIYLGTYKRLIWGSILALCCIVALWASTGAGPSKSLKPESHSAFISAPRAGFMTAMNAHAADGVSKDESKKTLRATLGKNFDRREAMKVALPGAIAAALTPAAAFAAKPPQIQSMRPPKGEKTGQIKTGNAGSIMKKR